MVTVLIRCVLMLDLGYVHVTVLQMFGSLPCVNFMH